MSKVNKDLYLEQIVQEKSDEDSSSESDSSSEESESQKGSMFDGSSIFNKSLNSNEDESTKPLDPQNYLYFTCPSKQKQSVLDTVDKNERSFKLIADKMIEKASQLQLNQQVSEHKSLMTQRLYSQIAEKFHGDSNIAQGIPYSIAAIEDFIAIGCSDGSVRLFDDTE